MHRTLILATTTGRLAETTDPSSVGVAFGNRGATVLAVRHSDPMETALRVLVPQALIVALRLRLHLPFRLPLPLPLPLLLPHPAYSKAESTGEVQVTISNSYQTVFGSFTYQARGLLCNTAGPLSLSPAYIIHSCTMFMNQVLPLTPTPTLTLSLLQNAYLTLFRTVYARALDFVPEATRQAGPKSRPRPPFDT